MALATEGTPLTAREREIAALVPTGLTSQEIARRLFISRRTVDSHLSAIYAKTRTGSRVKLTLWLMEYGDLPDAEAGTR